MRSTSNDPVLTELLAIINEEPELLAILVPPGLPLQPPDYELPPEWQPAPPWTPEEQAEYDATLGEMARVIEGADLIDWLGRRFGVRLLLDERGRLRAEGPGDVPAPVKSEVRRRQAALVALLAGKCDGDTPAPAPLVHRATRVFQGRLLTDGDEDDA